MSESSKKRCRKSKLVPRTYDLEDNINVADNASSSEKELPDILKIKQEIENDEYNDQDNISSPLQNDVANPLQNYVPFPLQDYQPSTMQFSIKVEVEECDELDLDIKEEPITEEDNFADITENLVDATENVNVTKTENEPSISDIDISKEADMLLMKAENIDLEPNMSEECVDSSTILNYFNTPQDSPMNDAKVENVTGRYFTLSIEDILSYQPKPNDVAGKMLCIEIRNILGRRIINGSLEMDHHEILVQKALELEQDNDALLMYKCYICNKAWWYLYPFREHIRQHNDEDFMVNLESNHSKEINMIAYKGIVPQITDIEIHDNCWHCGKGYSNHKLSERNTDSSYNCFYCSKNFFTCSQLTTHEELCFWQMHRVLEDKSECYNCPYCLLVVFKQIDLDNHLIFRHSVRSDIPMQVTFRHCPYCKGKYFHFNLHVCPKRRENTPCVHCNRKFANKVLCDMHLSLSKSSVKCPVCCVVLAKQCMLSRHLLDNHSTDFMLCAKCTKCSEFIVCLDEEAQRDHTRTYHKVKHDRRRCIYESVLIPKKILVNPFEGALTTNPTTRKILKKPTIKSKVIPELLTNCRLVTDDLPTTDMNNDAVKVVTIKRERLESDDELDFESIIQINQIGEDFTIKSEQMDDYDDHVCDIKKEMEDIDDMESDISYEQLLNNQDCHAGNPESNVYKVSLNFTKTKRQVEAQDNDITEDLFDEKEVKVEPEDNDEDITFDENLKLNTLEPEVILKPGYRQRRIYQCRKCGYKNYHKEYRLHINNKCNAVREIKEVIEKNRSYGCTRCNITYSSMKKYLQHLTKHGYSDHSCPVCLQQFESFTLLSAHVNYHVKKSYVRLLLINRSSRQTKVFQCKKCKGKVVFANFFAHWESHLEHGPSADVDFMENSEEPVSTALEPGVLRELLKLLMSSERGSKRQIVRNCNVCHRHFDRVNDSKRHLIEHLLVDAYANKPENKALKCQICRVSFWKPDGYKHHMRDHGCLPVYKCEMCNKTFSDSSNFTKHKKIHNLRAFICDVCGKKFQAKLSIEKHVQMHLVTDPKKCYECPKVFYTESAYKKHMRNKHDKISLKYKCIICTKRFVSLKDKWDHMWHVHEERKEKADCPICDMSFRKYSDVKNHVKTEHDMCITVLKKRVIENVAKKRMAAAIRKSVLTDMKEEKNEGETLIVLE